MMMGAHSLNNHQGTLEFVPAVWRNGWLVGWLAGHLHLLISLPYYSRGGEEEEGLKQ